MIYAAIAFLAALGLKLFLGWPFWATLITFGIFAALAYLVQNVKGAWVKPAAVIMTVIVMGGIISTYASGRLPFTAKLKEHAWLSLDLKIADETTTPAVKAKAAALLAQTELEDKAVDEVRGLVQKGKIDEAISEIAKLDANSKKLRKAINLPDPPDPHKTGKSEPISLFFPANNWSAKNLGWWETMELEPGEYEISATGTYTQKFSTGSSQYGPGGDASWVPPYATHLPIPSAHPCGLIAKTNRIGPIFIGEKGKMLVSEKTVLMLSTNMPHNWAAVGHPSEHFLHNSGGFEIKIQRLL